MRCGDPLPCVRVDPTGSLGGCAAPSSARQPPRTVPGLGLLPGLAGSAPCFLQEEKVYVQHRIRENRKLVWELLSSGSARVYLAG